MAAGEHEREPLVGNRRRVHFFLDLLLELGDELAQPPLTAQPVDRLPSRRDREPRAGVLRDARARPPLDRRSERLLERVLREVDVAQITDQGGDDPCVLLAEDALDWRYICQTGRTSIDPLSAAGIFAAYASASSTFSHSRT